MLMKCPECELQVSDKAISCPHCGYPINAKQSSRRTENKYKRKRLPNGFGQISEIKNRNLRNRFRAMVTVGKTDNGRPICKPLKPESYFATYNDAYAALIEYNKNPYDLSPSITVSELYNKWTEEYFKKLKSQSSIRTITACWKYCSSVYKMRASDIRGRHIKFCMENGTVMQKGVEKKPSPNIKSRIKSMFNLMLDYALEYELVEKNYARTFDISDEIVNDINSAKKGHIPFSAAEMDLLWNNIKTMKYIDVVLIQCYSGWRPQELGLIKIENVNLDGKYMVAGMKTDAGTNRIVPIHPKIYDLVVDRYNEAKELGSEYLLNCTDAKTHKKDSMRFTYDKYITRFSNIRDRLGLNEQHRPHDPRVHFVTQAKKYKVDEYAIKYIVGHSISDITEKVYTKREIDWLKEEISKIK